MDNRKNRKNTTGYVARNVSGADKTHRLVHIKLGNQDEQDIQDQQEEITLP